MFIFFLVNIHSTPQNQIIRFIMFRSSRQEEQQLWYRFLLVYCWVRKDVFKYEVFSSSFWVLDGKI
jgi:hypothetical protein